MAQSPRFLHRKSYRLRRLMDAVRLLPFLGLVLWALPLLWPMADDTTDAALQPVATSTALLYIFGVWLGLVVAGWLLWRKTHNLADREAQAGAGADAGPGSPE